MPPNGTSSGLRFERWFGKESVSEDLRDRPGASLRIAAFFVARFECRSSARARIRLFDEFIEFIRRPCSFSNHEKCLCELWKITKRSQIIEEDQSFSKIWMVTIRGLGTRSTLTLAREKAGERGRAEIAKTNPREYREQWSLPGQEN